jgi:cytochrome c biogenesis protein
MLKKKYRKVEKRETAQGDFLYGEKGRFSHFGVYLIHLSILIIIGGAVIGSLFGFDAYVQVTEGDAVDTIQLKGDRGAKKLNFTLRCDRFSVDFYEDGAPKEYRSDLTFLKNDSIAYRGSLLVNHPITFEGLRFYQASYGTVPDGKVTLSFRKGSGGTGQSTKVSSGDVFDLPDGHARGGKHNADGAGGEAECPVTERRYPVLGLHGYRRDQGNEPGYPEACPSL